MSLYKPPNARIPTKPWTPGATVGQGENNHFSWFVQVILKMYTNESKEPPQTNGNSANETKYNDIYIHNYFFFCVHFHSTACGWARLKVRLPQCIMEGGSAERNRVQREKVASYLRTSKARSFADTDTNPNKFDANQEQTTTKTRGKIYDSTWRRNVRIIWGKFSQNKKIPTSSNSLRFSFLTFLLLGMYLCVLRKVHFTFGHTG